MYSHRNISLICIMLIIEYLHKIMTRQYLLILIFIMAIKCQLDQSILTIIDRNEHNFLIRGNLPIKSKKFQFQQLKQTLDHMTNTSQYRLIVISLLNYLTPKESANRKIQKKYFKNKKIIDGTKVVFDNYIVLGSLINPGKIPESLRDWMLDYDDYISFDQIDTLMGTLEKYLNSKNPTVVYIHCSAGIDRTGYISGVYKMKYKGLSLKQVLKENLRIMRKKRKYMHFNTYNGLQWYCLKLRRSDKKCMIGKEQPRLKDL